MEARVVVAVAWFRLSRLVRCSSVRNLYSLSLTYSIGLHLSISLSLSLLLIWSPFISLASLFHARTLSLSLHFLLSQENLHWFLIVFFNSFSCLKPIKQFGNWQQSNWWVRLKGPKCSYGCVLTLYNFGSPSLSLEDSLKYLVSNFFAGDVRSRSSVSKEKN